MKPAYQQLRDERFKLWAQRRDMEDAHARYAKQIAQLETLRDGLGSAIAIAVERLEKIDEQITKLTVRRRP